MRDLLIPQGAEHKQIELHAHPKLGTSAGVGWKSSEDSLAAPLVFPRRFVFKVLLSFHLLSLASAFTPSRRDIS